MFNNNLVDPSKHSEQWKRHQYPTSTFEQGIKLNDASCSEVTTAFATASALHSSVCVCVCLFMHASFSNICVVSCIIRIWNMGEGKVEDDCSLGALYLTACSVMRVSWWGREDCNFHDFWMNKLNFEACSSLREQTSTSSTSYLEIMRFYLHCLDTQVGGNNNLKSNCSEIASHVSYYVLKLYHIKLIFRQLAKLAACLWRWLCQLFSPQL